jgi:hypothetical protein
MTATAHTGGLQQRLRRAAVLLGITATLSAAFASSRAAAMLPSPRDCVYDGEVVSDGSIIQATDPNGSILRLECRRGRMVQTR